jgi:pimeloyl-ACP methyl ester carboxylesterase
MQWFNDLQRLTTSPENALQIRGAFDQVDVVALLPQVRVPTLVLHCRDDGIVPFEEGRLIAAGIPGARFVALEGRNHLILENEPARARFFEELRNFLRS